MRTSEMARCREEYRRNSGSIRAALSAENLARRWLFVATAQRKQAEKDQSEQTHLTDEDKHLIALRVAQALSEMPLRHPCIVGVHEWVHHHMCSISRRGAPVGWMVKEVNSKLMKMLYNRPKVLEEFQWMFEVADILGGQDGHLTVDGISAAIRLGLWTTMGGSRQPPSRLASLLSSQGPSSCPEKIAQQFMDAVDLDGDGEVSYLEFMAYCLGRRREPVTLHFYDVSGGFAERWAPLLLGHAVEGIWHTGISAFGREYFYGGAILYHEPGMSSFGIPAKELHLGYTLREQDEIDNFICQELKPKFNNERYDLLENNCNHFTDALCMHMLGRHIPEEVLQQPTYVTDSRVGAALRLFLNGSLGNIKDANASSLTVAEGRNSVPAATPRQSTTEKRDATIIRRANCGTMGPGDILGQKEEKICNEAGSVWVKYFRTPGEAEGEGGIVREPIAMERTCVANCDKCGGRMTVSNYVAAMRAMYAQPPHNFSWTVGFLSDPRHRRHSMPSSLPSKASIDAAAATQAGPPQAAAWPGQSTEEATSPTLETASTASTRAPTSPTSSTASTESTHASSGPSIGAGSDAENALKELGFQISEGADMAGMNGAGKKQRGKASDDWEAHDFTTVPSEPRACAPNLPQVQEAAFSHFDSLVPSEPRAQEVPSALPGAANITSASSLASAAGKVTTHQRRSPRPSMIAARGGA